MIVNYTPLYDKIRQLKMDRLLFGLPEKVEAALHESRQALLPTWKELINALPQPTPSLVDLNSSEYTKLIDWDTLDIDWAGRGSDRGLRGIAFHKNNIYIAASDEIFIYDVSFEQVGSIKNIYLKHCHEIYAEEDKLYLTSTGFDSVLEYNLSKNCFTKGFTVRFSLPKVPY